MPQSEDIAPFIGIYHAYRLYRRQSLERTLQLLYAPIIQQLQRELTSRMDKWTLSLQMGFKAIESLQQRLRLGLRIVTMRSEEAQYMANVSLLSTTDEASRGRRLDWARCLLQWSESCAEWVNSFENGLKALNNHRMVLQTRQMRRREEIANLRLDVDGLGGLVKMNAAINAHRVEMVNFYHGIQSLHESVCPATFSKVVVHPLIQTPLLPL